MNTTLTYGWRFNLCQLEQRVGEAQFSLASCSLCPLACGVDRWKKRGACGTSRWAEVASFNAHFGEEPPISGKTGSGTIFFSHCNLHCIYCQNYPISQFGNGRTIQPLELADMMMNLQQRGCHNVNFVTPSHMVAQILEAILIAVRRGFCLPLVYNTSGYDSLKALALLDGIIDIYMPDMRYSNNEIAALLSGVKDYVEVNRAAIHEMHRQVGDLQLDQNGIAVRGLLIRHLILPNDLAGTRHTLQFIAQEISPHSHISLMSQYFPAHLATRHAQIGRRITRAEYTKAVLTLEEFGLENGWLQDSSELE
ncbi:MAG: radical SAM protein [Coprothermobacterota bacterium]|nr:radical SAM protein [Coprothermobacterota bacterium]